MKTLSILLSGYNQDESELIIMLLRRSGYEVAWETIQTRAELLRAIHHTYDCIITQFRASDFNVFGMMDTLKAQGIKTPVIVVSDNISEDIVDDCLRHGVFNVLTQVHLARLPLVIQHSLRQSQLSHEKERAESAMRLSEGRFRAIFEHAPDTLLVVDTETRTILSSNPAIAETLGYGMVNIIGEDALSLVADDAKPIQDYTNHLRQALEQGETRLHSFPIRRADASICWMDIVITSLPWETQQALLINLRDVSDRVSAERKLREAHRLRLKLEKEREVGKIKSNFITLASHEFRTPLTAIQTSTDILRRYSDRLSDDDKLKHYNRITRRVKHMRDLMDDVIMAGRLQSGALTIQPTNIDLSTLLDDFFDHAKDDYPDHHIVHQHPPNLTIRADEWLMKRILHNLISNATKYSREGTTVHCRVEADADYVRLHIHDEGIGIPPEDIERIFEPFHRGRNSNDVGGTGLGLAITREAIELHGGTIAIKSQLGAGTQVQVILPRLARLSTPTPGPDDDISDEESQRD